MLFERMALSRKLRAATACQNELVLRRVNAWLFQEFQSGILLSMRLVKAETMNDVILPEGAYSDTLPDVVELLEEGRRTAARSINALMTATYWLFASDR